MFLVVTRQITNHQSCLATNAKYQERAKLQIPLSSQSQYPWVFIYCADENHQQIINRNKTCTYAGALQGDDGNLIHVKLLFYGNSKQTLSYLEKARRQVIIQLYAIKMQRHKHKRIPSRRGYLSTHKLFYYNSRLLFCQIMECS